MAERFILLAGRHRAFIARRHLCFVGSAGTDGRVNYKEVLYACRCSGMYDQGIYGIAQPRLNSVLEPVLVRR